MPRVANVQGRTQIARDAIHDTSRGADEVFDVIKAVIDYCEYGCVRDVETDSTASARTVERSGLGSKGRDETVDQVVAHIEGSFDGLEPPEGSENGELVG